jgi:hypothetical protein
MGLTAIVIEEGPMSTGFELICKLVDEFSAEQNLPILRGAKPKQDDFFYMKLAFFGILNRCREKSHYLERARRQYPHLFKKSFLSPLS